MWIRFLKDTEDNKYGDTVWISNIARAKELNEEGIVALCTSPKGISFEEAMPEDVEAYKEEINFDEK